MLKGCEHCGRVLRPMESAAFDCPECGRPLVGINPAEARELMRERRIAEQFERASRLTHVIDAGRALRPGGAADGRFRVRDRG